MEKGIYIYRGSTTEFSGVDKKIDAQIEALSRRYDVYKVVIEKENTTIIKSISWRLPLGSWGAKYDEALDKIQTFLGNEKLVFIYIRGQALDRRYVRFLKKLRERHTSAKILYEIPTFPYFRECLQSKSMWPWAFKDYFNRKNFNKLIDRVVTFSNNDYIFGVPTIRTKNGILIKEKKIDYNIIANKDDAVINLLAVAQFQKSHGYERVIEGLAQFYSVDRPDKVMLHMVGAGDEKNRYERLVTKLGIGKYVVFHGLLYGTDLEEIYQKADLGMGCFGLYKRHIYTISSLKIAEYLSHGLPVITGIKEEIFKELDSDYYLEFPNDDSQVDINKIVEYYKGLKKKYSLKEIREHISNFAKRNMDISVTMEPVLNYIMQSK